MLWPLGLAVLVGSVVACGDDHDSGAEDHQHAGSAGSAGDAHQHGGDAGAAGHSDAGAGGAAGHEHGGEGGMAGSGGAMEGPEHMACEAVVGAAKPLTAATDAAEASAAKMTPGEAFLIERQAATPSYVSFENSTMHANWTLFLKETGAVSGVSFGAEAVELPTSVAVDHCSNDLPASYALHLHEPGLYTIALTPGAALWAMLVEGEAGH